MSTKRSGSRDISDLKARLGLKKKAEAAPAAAAVPPPAGVVPPPGRATGAVPVPPGVAPPAPAAPVVPQQVVPDASEDPFGAMNAIAANQAAVAQATGPAPIVVVNDGRPVESVEKSSKIGRYARIAAMILGPLVFGMVIGQIGSKAANYNRTIEDAAKIRVDVEATGKRLLEYQQVLQVAQDRGKREGKPWFKLNDEKLTGELAALEPLAPNAEVVFKSFIYDLPPEISEQIFLYYTEIGRLQKEIKEHIALSKRDAKVIVKGKENTVKFFQGPRLAGLYETPSAEAAAKGVPAAFKLVQLGLMICEDNGKPQPACEGGKVPVRFQYRLSENGEFGTKKVVGSDGVISSGNLVMMNPDTAFFKGLVTGGKPSVAEVAYMDRVEAINKKVNDLVGVRKFILDVLNNKSNESKKFTFFM